MCLIDGNDSLGEVQPGSRPCFFVCNIHLFYVAIYFSAGLGGKRGCEEEKSYTHMRTTIYNRREGPTALMIPEAGGPELRLRRPFTAGSAPHAASLGDTLVSERSRLWSEGKPTRRPPPGSLAFPGSASPGHAQGGSGFRPSVPAGPRYFPPSALCLQHVSAAMGSPQ